MACQSTECCFSATGRCNALIEPPVLGNGRLAAKTEVELFPPLLVLGSGPAWRSFGNSGYAAQLQPQETIAMNDRFTSTLSRNRRIPLGLVGLLLAASFAGVGGAAEPIQTLSFTPFQLSLAPPAQIFPQEVPVRGLRINVVYGVQREVSGLDVGLFNEVREKLSGIGAGLLNIARADATGLHVGAANTVSGEFRGLQIAFANHNEGNLAGAQIGVGNVTEGGAGLQVGLFNQAGSLKGLQIGLFNINENGFLPFFPIINFGF
jgi:hypothetical protein